MKQGFTVLVCALLVVSTGCSQGGSSGDPCQGVPEKGVCEGETGYKWCDVSPEKGTSVKTQACQSYEGCQLVSGEAKCVLKQGKCLPGSTKCDGTKLGTCNQSGTLDFTNCATTCKEMPILAYCVPGTATTQRTAQLKYQAKDIDRTTMNKWSDLFEVNAAGVLIVSLRGNTVVDSAKTDKDGKFTIGVPTDIQTGDTLTAVAARPITGGTGVGVSMAVANPKFSEGKNSTDDVVKATGEFWVWKFDLAATPAETYLITNDKSSGAMRMFDWMNRLMDLAEGSYPSKPSQPLAVWMQPNVTWDCGACQWDQDVRLGGFLFARNIVSEMSVQNEQYWSLAVFAHEFGHYVMSVWGTSPGEAGRHCTGYAYPPGLSWSEGWATWYSAEARRDTGIGKIYYDKQQGSFFTTDIEARQFSGGTAWQRPTANAGLLQNILEDEVSAIMWTLSSSTLKAPPLYNALSGTRMNQSPFGRDYKRQSWNIASNGCTPTEIKASDVSVPMLADFLDALVCAGASAAVVDSATVPDRYYPYPSNSPICK